MADDWLGTLEGAAMAGAKGVAAGSMGGPMGMAAGGLIGVASSLVPHVFGPAAQPALSAVARAITGETEEAKQVQVLTTDPAAIAQFKVQALQIAADREQAQLNAQSDDLAARLGDVASARAQTVQLTQAGTKMAWGSAIVSAVLLTAWFSSLVANYFHAQPLGADDAAVLRNLALLVAGYWIGSSAGSARKDERLARAVPGDLVPQPAAIVPAADVPK